MVLPVSFFPSDQRAKVLVHGASSGNSGIICTGYDAPQNSLEQRCLRLSRQLRPQHFAQLQIACKPTGALVGIKGKKGA